MAGITNEGAMRALLAGIGKQFKKVGGKGVTITKDRTAEIMSSLDVLVRHRVLVGIPADKADRKDADDEVNNAARLYIHEHGAPEARPQIPARPTVGPGIAAAQPRINAGFKRAAAAAMSGNPQGIQVALHEVGTVARDSIKNKISSNTPPPLSERTLQERRAVGNASTKTLEATGEMRNAVNYVVERK